MRPCSRGGSGRVGQLLALELVGDEQAVVVRGRGGAVAAGHLVAQDDESLDA